MSNPWLRFSLGAGLIVTLTFAAYAPALNGPFLFDDFIISQLNPAIRADDGLFRLWCKAEATNYEPVTYSVFWLCWRVFGEATLGYHVVNVALHAAAAILLWHVLRRLAVPGAWLAGLLFALHPVNVEAAAYVFQIRNTLSTALALAAVVSLLRFEEQDKRRWYVLALACFLLALLSKAAVVMVPPIWLLLTWWRRGTVTGMDVKRIAPFFLLSLLMGLTEIFFQQQRAISGALVRPDGWTGRIAGAGWATWFYLAKALAPWNLSFCYPLWRIDTSSILAYLPGVAVLMSAFGLWKWGRVRGRAVLAGLGCYLLALLPVLGFLDISYMLCSLVADHWQYLALTAIIGLVVGSTATVVGKQREGVRYAGYALACLVIVLLGMLTWQRARLFSDPELLYRDAIAHYPTSAAAWRRWRMNCNAGVRKLKRSMRPKRQLAKIRVFTSLIIYWPRPIVPVANSTWLSTTVSSPEISCPVPPRFNSCWARRCWRPSARRRPLLARAALATTRERLPGLHLRLGQAYLQVGDAVRAAEHLELAVRDLPDEATGHRDLANAWAELGRSTEAEAEYRLALTLDEGMAAAHVGLGKLHAQRGQAQEAIACFAKAAGVDPKLAAAHGAWGELLLGQGKTAEAKQQFLAALGSDPKCMEAHAVLGDLATAENNVAKAIEHYDAAVRLRPQNPELRKTLGDLRLRQGDARGALEQYRCALQLRPAWPAVASRVAWLLATHPEPGVRSGAKAVELAEQTCRIGNGRDSVALDTLAAAYAEAGRFAEAAVTARRAIDLALASQQGTLAREAQDRLLLYEQRRPYRTP